MPRRLAIIVSVVVLALALGAGSAQALKVSRMMAPGKKCEGQTRLSASAGSQERAMRCMINFARKRAGLRKLDRTRKLDRAAGFKSQDIVRCDSFSHEACGRDFTYWLERVGYIGGCWSAGENIAWGKGSFGTVRSIMKAWLQSAGHRANILSRSYRDFGVGLDTGGLDGYRRAHVWTTHFGSHC
jgi:uncharacterized protein YkwD